MTKPYGERYNCSVWKVKMSDQRKVLRLSDAFFLHMDTEEVTLIEELEELYNYEKILKDSFREAEDFVYSLQRRDEEQDLPYEFKL